MEERKFVGVLIGLEGGFVHQSANGEVRHYEAVEFLANQVGGLAAQDDFGTAQMSFEFGERSFDFPPLMIERRQFLGRSLVGIENGGHEPVDRLSTGNTFQTIFDDAHLHAIGLVSSILFGWIDMAQIGTIRKFRLTRKERVGLDPPEQIGPVWRARFHIEKQKNCRSAKHNMPGCKLGRTPLAKVFSPVS